MMTNTNDLRQQIASVILDRWRVLLGDETYLQAAERFADAVLPVVTAWAEQQTRQRAAQELREAAEACPTTLWYPWFIARADTLAAEG